MFFAVIASTQTFPFFITKQILPGWCWGKSLDFIFHAFLPLGKLSLIVFKSLPKIGKTSVGILRTSRFMNNKIITLMIFYYPDAKYYNPSSTKLPSCIIQANGGFFFKRVRFYRCTPLNKPSDKKWTSYKVNFSITMAVQVTKLFWNYFSVEMLCTCMQANFKLQHTN